MLLLFLSHFCLWLCFRWSMHHPLTNVLLQWTWSAQLWCSVLQAPHLSSFKKESILHRFHCWSAVQSTCELDWHWQLDHSTTHVSGTCPLHVPSFLVSRAELAVQYHSSLQPHCCYSLVQKKLSFSKSFLLPCCITWWECWHCALCGSRVWLVKKIKQKLKKSEKRFVCEKNVIPI